MRESIIPVRALERTVIDLRQQKDHRTQRILFDVSGWLEEYPEGEIRACAQPPGGEVYPVALTMEGGLAVWTVTDSDTAQHGSGHIQLALVGPDGEKLHSAIGHTLIRRSLCAQAGAAAPEAAASWFEQMETKLDGKLDKPADRGKTGQVLGLGEDGVTAWIDPPAGGGSGGAGLPVVDETDDGKVLMVVGGKWAANSLPLYDGAYSVTPSADAQQRMQTAQKLMDADVVIEKIPYSEVSNTANGTTVIIG